ncbi:MAG TPA: helix-turn-helix transcriptional regulator [Flavipsychrobacter sp.]|nr:helix-turn-helix transcriptional regulator [Flavipsychrobacter sp.]
MPHMPPYRIKSIQEFHQLRGLPKPEHPLISVVRYSDIRHDPGQPVHSWTQDFYSVALKRSSNAKIRYGQQEYDFDEGVMFFIAPGQVFSVEINPATAPWHSGWMLLIHPDFLWKSGLAKEIRQYEYFGYSVHEALFLSEKEELIITQLIENVRQEYHANIDRFSQRVIIAQLELLLTYCDRFYHRQFLTRNISNHKMLEQLDKLLQQHFAADDIKGIPTVQQVADALHVSPNYLSSLLKVLTGQSTQQHIHDKLIEKAKEQLSTTGLSVSEIAYALGFEHPQSFSKLFKSKTNQSPLAFRQSFS